MQAAKETKMEHTVWLSELETILMNYQVNFTKQKL